MQKWEYLMSTVKELKKTIKMKGSKPTRINLEALLSTMSKYNWELVAVDKGMAYFKRPIKE